MYMSRVLRADQQDLVKDYFCMVSRPATIETEKGKLISYSISEITKSDLFHKIYLHETCCVWDNPKCEMFVLSGQHWSDG